MYFKKEEFTLEGEIVYYRMNANLLTLLEVIRGDVGEPLTITSSFRTREYELAHGRTGNSAHTLGLAVDLACTTAKLRYKIINSAIKRGVTRIGIGKDFIHIDISTSHEQQVIWHYY